MLANIAPPVCSSSGRVAAAPPRQPWTKYDLVGPQHRAAFGGLRQSVQLQQACSRLLLSTCRAAATGVLEYGTDWSVAPDAYLVLGLAHCFEKNDEGKLIDRMVIEPLSANSLECMAAGAKTCFKAVTSVRLSEALARNTSALPEEFQGGVYCNDYDFRCSASARTWLRPHAQDNLMDLVPLGQTKTKFNFNLDEKRLLNFENVVNDDDNIKQDLSIDVYGRKEKAEEEEAAAKAAEAPASSALEEDDMDALLSG